MSKKLYFGRITFTIVSKNGKNILVVIVPLLMTAPMKSMLRKMTIGKAAHLSLIMQQKNDLKFKMSKNRLATFRKAVTKARNWKRKKSRSSHLRIRLSRQMIVTLTRTTVKIMPAKTMMIPSFASIQVGYLVHHAA